MWQWIENQGDYLFSNRKSRFHLNRAKRESIWEPAWFKVSLLCVCVLRAEGVRNRAKLHRDTNYTNKPIVEFADSFFMRWGYHNAVPHMPIISFYELRTRQIQFYFVDTNNFSNFLSINFELQRSHFFTH